jgi:hypothetical protein
LLTASAPTAASPSGSSPYTNCHAQAAILCACGASTNERLNCGQYTLPSPDLMNRVRIPLALSRAAIDW